MSRTVIALYDDFATAQDVVEALVDAGFPRDNISLIANDASGEYAGYLDDDDVSAGEGAGFGAVVGGLVGLGVALIPGIGPVLAAGPLAAAAMAGAGAVVGAATGGLVAGLVDLGMSEEEAGHYAEGIRRGGVMVSATVNDAEANRAQEIMNRYHPVNLNERVASWEERGYTGYNASAQPYTMDDIHTERSHYRTLDTGEEARFEVVEEELRVGKRDVEKGGVRVESHVVETPVQEEVRLREEHVRVERRPVDRPASTADIGAFEEGVIEVTEHAEEPIVSKTARVIEEVIIGKEATERTERVSDTVRRTEVDVQPMGTSTTRYNAYESYEPTFRSDYQTRFGNMGNYSYEQAMPAYRYGYSLATNDRYRDYDWARVEPEARRYWDERNPDTWEDFKDSIRHAWDTIRGRA